MREREIFLLVLVYVVHNGYLVCEKLSAIISEMNLRKTVSLAGLRVWAKDRGIPVCYPKPCASVYPIQKLCQRQNSVSVSFVDRLSTAKIKLTAKR